MARCSRAARTTSRQSEGLKTVKQQRGLPPDTWAEAANLRYVNDDETGLTRHRSGDRFYYRTGSGHRVTKAAVIRRIEALAIPPAWTDVWICRDGRGHIQATGRDLRGRKQYRYHTKWSEIRGANKFANLTSFADSLPTLRRRVNQDLTRRGTPRPKVVAAIVWLLDNAMIRVGNATYARSNGSFGLTTLRKRHLRVEGSFLKFAFRGKSGKEWMVQLHDRRMARIVRQIQEVPGQALFQYVDAAGQRFAISSDDVNEYIRTAAGGQFSSKDFRTWGGTVRALALFAERLTPQGERNASLVCNQIVDQVAERLGNTRAVCRKGYIHPGVVESWRSGKLPAELKSIRARSSTWMDRHEAVAAKWLKKKAASDR